MISLDKAGKKRIRPVIVRKSEYKKKPEEVPAFFPLTPETGKTENLDVKKDDSPVKIVVYTCITGGYDNLIRPAKTEGVDYICFTDNIKVSPNGWIIKPIPEGLEGLTNVKKQRMIKVLPHKYLSEYDISIWVDGSVEVKGDVMQFMKPFIYDGHSIFIPDHPARNCIYRECDAVKALKKDTTDLPDKQMKKYKEEGYPVKNGLVQSNIMVRWHNDEDCIKVMELWANEIMNFSHRDQLSFNYALWKSGLSCFKALDKKTCNSAYFKWNVKHNVGSTVKIVKKK